MGGSRQTRELKETFMTGDAYQVIEKFWKNQDSGDYTTTEHLFAEDALFVDPVYGIFQGRREIGAFLLKNEPSSKVNQWRLQIRATFGK